MSEVFIATPMYGGMCHGAYAISLFQTIPAFMNAGVGLRFGYNMNHSLVTRARDDLVADFLPTPATHLMFIDSDIGFEAADILGMLAFDKDVICGLYPRKEINWGEVEAAVREGVPASKLGEYTGRFVVNTLPGEAPIESYSTMDGPVEVLNAGTGFMLIKRKVLEVVAARVPEYWAGEVVRRQVFATGVAEDLGGAFLSEDWFFCRLARECGFSVWVDPGVRLTHSGSYTFSGRLS